MVCCGDIGAILEHKFIFLKAKHAEFSIVFRIAGAGSRIPFGVPSICPGIPGAGRQLLTVPPLSDEGRRNAASL